MTTIVADDFSHAESEVSYWLRSNGESTPVLPTEPVAAMSGDRVTVRGSTEDGHLVGAIQQISEDQTGPVEQSRTLAVVLANFESEPIEPWTPEDVRRDFFGQDKSSAAFYREESYGRLTFRGKDDPNGDLYGWVTIKDTNAGCAFGNWIGEAGDILRKEAIGNIHAYDHILLITPTRGGCAHGGIATLGGKLSWIYGRWKVEPHHFVAAHELGHNLGFMHANSIRCFDAAGAEVTLSADAVTCTSQEYMDEFDVMGYQYRHHHGASLAKLGVLEPSNVLTVRNSGTYSIRDALEKTSQPTVLRVPRSWNEDGEVIEWYDAEVRRPAMRSSESTSPFELSENEREHNGVSIRFSDPVSAYTHIIDASPGDPWPGCECFATWDAPFLAGETFDDGRTRITPLEAGNGRARIKVELDESIEDKPPAPPVLTDVTRVEAGLEVKWEESDDDGGVSQYLVFRDGIQIGITSALDLIDPLPSPGLHVYTVYAEDGYGHRSDVSNALTFDVPDESRPTTPTKLTASLSGKGVTLSWAASSDNVKVARYRVRRDGIEIGSTQALVFTDPLLPSAPRFYTILAEDAAGNRSSLSVPLTVADITPPSTPAELSVTQVALGGVSLHWSPSTDDVSVSRYIVYRDGKEIGSSLSPLFYDPALAADSPIYAIRAEDQAGNRSAAQELRLDSRPRESASERVPPDTGPSENRGGSQLRLSYRQVKRGVFLLVAKDLGLPPGGRLELWIDGQRVRVARGPQLKVTWKRPPHRLRATVIKVREIADAGVIAQRDIRVPGARTRD